MRRDNSGYSLIEVIAALAVLAVASVAILQFINISTTHYQKENSEVEVQYEAQVTINQINDLLIDAKSNVKYTYNGGTLVTSDALIPAGVTLTSKEFLIDNTYKIIWKAADKKLYYRDGTMATTDDDVLMAEYVESFSVDLTNTAENGLVRLKLLFKRDREYDLSQNVTIRNKVTVN